MTLSTSQLELYWNVFRNIQAGVTDGYNFDRETLTYVQADPRYLQYLDQYLATTSLSDADKARIRIEAETNSTRARATINSDAYSYSTAIHGLANDLYWAVEHDDRDVLGTIADPPAGAPVLVADLDGDTTAPAPSELDIAGSMVVAPIEPADAPYVAPADAATPPDGEPLRITVTSGMMIGWPIGGTIIKEFGGPEAGSPNQGVNIEAPAGTEVHAADEGIVFHAGDDIEGYGNLVIIKHRDTDVYTVYAHLDEINVATGDTIAKDQIIGTVGQTGGVTSPQLHFEIRIGSTPHDPVEYIGSLPPDPVMAAATPSFTDYTVEAGDSLWRIAREQYGLTDNREIARAVEHIANANDMTAGTAANHIDIGQVLHLPDAGTLTGAPATSLNWPALDYETRTGQIIRGDFSSIDGGEPIMFHTEPDENAQPLRLAVRGSLSRAVQEAAAEFGITDMSARDAYLAALRVADANDIDNANVVAAGREVTITRAMLSAAPS